MALRYRDTKLLTEARIKSYLDANFNNKDCYSNKYLSIYIIIILT